MKQWNSVGDVEADAVVHDIQSVHGDESVIRLLPKVGRWTPDKPISDVDQDFPEAASYLMSGYAFPAWIELERVERAQRCYRQNANVGRIVLGVYSLPVLYLHPEITATLMGTGQLVQHAGRRIKETQAFVDNAMVPGTLAQAGHGWQWMRKVRLTHAVLRAVASLKSPLPSPPSGLPPGLVFDDPLPILRMHFNYAQPGKVALSQAQLAFVLLTFSWAIVDGLAKLRFALNEGQADDHIHAWAVVGHMIGIVDDLLPGGPILRESDAKPLFDHILRGLLAVGDPVGVPASQLAEDGRVLMGALMTVLVDEQRRITPKRFRKWVARFAWLDDALQDVPRTFVRKLSGVPTARMLHLGRAPLLHWLIGKLALATIDLKTWDPDGEEFAHALSTRQATTLPQGLF